MALLLLLLFCMFFFGGMFLLVIFQAGRHREALELIATQQRAMQAELSRLADILESLVAERPFEEDEAMDEEDDQDSRESGKAGSGQGMPLEPGFELLLERGGEGRPAKSGGEAEYPENFEEDGLDRLFLRSGRNGSEQHSEKERGGLPELKL